MVRIISMLAICLWVGFSFHTTLLATVVIPTNQNYQEDGEYQKIDGVYSASALEIGTNIYLIPIKTENPNFYVGVTQKRDAKWQKLALQNILSVNILKRIKNSKLFLQLHTLNHRGDEDQESFNENSLALGFAIFDKGYETVESVYQQEIEEGYFPKGSPEIFLVVAGIKNTEQEVGNYPSPLTSINPFIGIRYDAEHLTLKGTISYRQGEKILPQYTYTENAEEADQITFYADMDLRQLAHQRVGLKAKMKVEYADGNINRKIYIIVPSIALIQNRKIAAGVKKNRKFQIVPTLNLNLPVSVVQKNEQNYYSFGASLSGDF